MSDWRWRTGGMGDTVVRMLLYNSQVSGNCWKVRQILAHRGIAYERHELDVVDRSNRPEVLGGLNPALRVPTIVLDDGRPLAESNAILGYFADGTDYLPTDAYTRAQVYQWLFFEQYNHEPSIAVARFISKYVPETPDPQRLAALHEAGYRALDAMEGRLAGHDFLVGDAYTIADIALYAYTHVAEDGGFDLARYPGITAWLARVAAQPGHVTLDA